MFKQSRRHFARDKYGSSGLALTQIGLYCFSECIMRSLGCQWMVQQHNVKLQTVQTPPPTLESSALFVNENDLMRTCTSRSFRIFQCACPYKRRQNAGTVSAVLMHHHLMSDLRRLRERVLLKFKGRKNNNKASLGAGLPILALLMWHDRWSGGESDTDHTPTASNITNNPKLFLLHRIFHTLKRL